MPGLLGNSITNGRRPIAVECREHPAGSEDAGDLGERGRRLHPVQCLHRQHHVGTAVGETSGVGPACRVSHVRLVRHRGSANAHVAAGFDPDHLGRPPRSPTSRQTRATPEIDDELRPVGPGVAIDNGGEHLRRHGSNGVVQIGEPGEAIGIRVEAHGEKLATDVIAHSLLDQSAP